MNPNATFAFFRMEKYSAFIEMQAISAEMPCIISKILHYYKQ